MIEPAANGRTAAQAIVVGCRDQMRRCNRRVHSQLPHRMGILCIPSDGDTGEGGEGLRALLTAIELDVDDGTDDGGDPAGTNAGGHGPGGH